MASRATHTEQNGPAITVSWCQGVRSELPGRLANHESIANDEYAPISAAQQYIKEHLDENLTQDKVAQVVRLSRTQFIRRFREESGQTFNQFVTACRLAQAKVLLQETEFTINFIYTYITKTYFYTQQL